MSIQDKVITLKGDQAAVAHIHIFPQVDGSFIVTATGITKDSGGNIITLSEVRKSYPTGTNVLDNMTTTALAELRKQNGLEV